MQRIYGIVKFVSEKGFAFLKRDDGQKDAFVHNSEVQRCGLAVPLVVGQRLSFDIEDAPRGSAAVNLAIATTVPAPFPSIQTIAADRDG